MKEASKEAVKQPLRLFGGEANGNPLQYSCLQNSIDRGATWALVHGGLRVGHD